MVGIHDWRLVAFSPSALSFSPLERGYLAPGCAGCNYLLEPRGIEGAFLGALRQQSVVAGRAIMRASLIPEWTQMRTNLWKPSSLPETIEISTCIEAPSLLSTCVFALYGKWVVFVRQGRDVEHTCQLALMRWPDTDKINKDLHQLTNRYVSLDVSLLLGWWMCKSRSMPKVLEFIEEDDLHGSWMKCHQQD